MTTSCHLAIGNTHGTKEGQENMKAFIIYDSQYGNTEQIAQAIGDGLTGDVKVVRASDVNPSELKPCDLLILGSPTHGGFPTENIYGLLKASLALEGVNVAAFDTRTKTTIFGYAAPKIAKGLKSNGGNLLAPPEGFIVLGMHGPLNDGELERATKWAQQLPLPREVSTTITS
jgi:flavodoxin